MTPMIPGFNPMQMNVPQQPQQSGTAALAQNLLKAALQPRGQPGAAQPAATQPVAPVAGQPMATQPAVPANTAQVGLLGKLFANARPAAPDGMLPDTTGLASSISGLR